jgi:superfamily II DNA or RNA helicase/HKD family nuclease
MSKEQLKTGIYNLLCSSAMREAISREKKEDRAVWIKWDLSRLAKLVAQSISREVEARFSEFSKSSQIHEPANQLIRNFLISEEFQHVLNAALPCEDQVLEEIKTFSGDQKKQHPDTPLNESAILTPDGLSPHLGTQLRKELESCDRADWLVSFIKLRGINEMLPEIRAFVSTPTPDGSPRLRIATTTYMGASDKKAIEKLLELPNTEIRVSFDEEKTRLHAKAYLFFRETGFSTAYIGSANISQQALNYGLEWTAKISQYELPYLWRRARAAFDICWNDNQNFLPCTQSDIDKIGAALNRARGHVSGDASSTQLHVIDVNPYTYQRIILEDIQSERENDRHRHLVISATGTGKTMVAAFDYRAFAKGGRPRFLYVVHRKDILLQAREKFRAVLKDSGFGHLATGDSPDPPDSDILFCTLQSWNTRGYDKLPPDHFSYVVVDEAHHAPSKTYLQLLEHIKPAVDAGKTEVLGLTATPDRMDGQDIRKDFGGSFTHELNLCQAINNGHLSSFSYFGVADDSVNYEHVTWRSKTQAEAQITQALENNLAHADNVFNQVLEHVPSEAGMRALGFCAGVKHAKFMSEFFNKHGIKATFLTGQDTRENREQAVRSLSAIAQDRISVVFIADLFNEGVDIPCVDTILLLRPTDSLTILMQQLGRGLRLHPGKDTLLILDFIARHNDNFNLAARYRMLTTRPGVSLEAQIQHGMPFLPVGCSITLEKRVQEMVLENLKAFTDRLRGQRLVREIENLVVSVGCHVPLPDMLAAFNLDRPIPIYKAGMPSRIEQRALGVAEDPEFYDKQKVQNCMQRVSLVDNPDLIVKWQSLLRNPHAPCQNLDLLRYFLACLFKQSPSEAFVIEFWQAIEVRPGLKRDLCELLEWRSRNLLPVREKVFPQTSILQLHRSYTKDQIVMALGGNPAAVREGIWHNPYRKIDVFFVTIDKNDNSFSQTTMYADYAITRDLFHWQSQSTAAAESPTASRYIQHRDNGYTPILFARPQRRTIDDLTSPYYFLGPVSYESHEGSKPISFTWRMQESIPASIFDWAKLDVA